MNEDSAPRCPACNGDGGGIDDDEMRPYTCSACRGTGRASTTENSAPPRLRRTWVTEPYGRSFASHTGNPWWLVYAQAEWTELAYFNRCAAACTSEEAAEAAQRLLRMPTVPQ